jgi:hypothetical protein
MLNNLINSTIFRFYLQLMFFIIFYIATALSIYLNRNYFTFLTNLSKANNSNISNKFDCFHVGSRAIEMIENEYCNCIYRDPIDPDRYVIDFYFYFLLKKE